MIPSQLTLERFVRSKLNFFLYGPRSSGKTTLLRQIFQNAKMDYIYINCTMGDKKVNFFKYLNHEMHKFLKKKRAKQNPTMQTILQKPADPISTHAWLEMIKSLDPSQRVHLKKMYLFIDNIEEIHVSANFLTNFFVVCQQELDGFKIPFVFCGVNLPRKIYAVDKPFRNITSFCMPKPLKAMKDIIKSTVKQCLSTIFQHEKEQNVQIAAHSLSIQIYHAFQPIETDLNKIRKIANSLTKAVGQKLDIQMKQLVSFNKEPTTINKAMSKNINCGHFKQLLKNAEQDGPINDFIMNRKIKSTKQDEMEKVQLPYEFYPNLLMTACHMADLRAEKYDRIRFKDYKKSKTKGVTASQNRITRHNLQRVIAIAEVLEGVSNNQDKEKLYDHHTLDFYGCIEFLKDEGKFYNAGSKNVSFASGRLHGMIKQEEVKTFCKKSDISYSQFSDRIA